MDGWFQASEYEHERALGSNTACEMERERCAAHSATYHDLDAAIDDDDTASACVMDTGVDST